MQDFLAILSEAGIVGLIPYLALTGLIVLRFIRPHPLADPGFDAWRPYFFAGFVASMIQNMFNEYTWERLIWYSVAYVAALERLEWRARAALLREQMNARRPFADLPLQDDLSPVGSRG